MCALKAREAGREGSGEGFTSSRGQDLAVAGSSSVKLEDSRRSSEMLRKGEIQAKRADSGQTLVEFALAAAIFLMLLFAVIDFGYFFYVKVTLQNAVRQAGRYAITGTCTAGTNCFVNGSGDRYNSIVQVALNYSFGMLTAANVTITCLPPPIGLTGGCPGYGGGAGGPGDTVMITATYTWNPVTAWIARIFTGGAYTFNVSATFRNESFPPPAS